MRSVAYPAYTITECVRMVEIIYHAYGDSSFIDRKQIALSLALSEGAIVIRVSSCVQYGLLEKKTKVGYKPTRLFKQISRPINDEEADEGMLDAFRNPPLYQKIIEKFGGHKFPSSQAFENLLHRDFSISDKASNKAANVFLSNATQLGRINNENILLNGEEEPEYIDEDIIYDEPNPQGEIKNNTTNIPRKNEMNREHQTNKKDDINDTQLQPEKPQKVSRDNYNVIEIPLSNKKKASLSIPVDINKLDLRIIQKQLEVLELYVETTQEE